jgi:hypothetical protein
MVDGKAAVPEPQCLPVAQYASHVGARAPRPERAGDDAECGHQLLRDPVLEHYLAGVVVVCLRLGCEVLDEGHSRVDGSHVGAGVRSDQGDEAEMIDVLVGEDHEFDVLDGVTQAQ